MIPITVVEFGEDAERLVLEVLRSGNIAQGPLVKQFEDRFAQMIGVKHAIAVNNGTTSLVAALQVLDLRPGDEVVTSPFTFVATLNAILEAGATARFADIRRTTSTSTPRPRRERSPTARGAHAGAPLRADRRHGRDRGTGAERGLRLVEDSAQAARLDATGASAGSFGLGSFSFYATKNITTGEGGMVTTDDDVLADRLRILRNQGMRARYQYEMAGHN